MPITHYFFKVPHFAHPTSLQRAITVLNRQCVQFNAGVDMQTQDDRRWPVGQLKTPPRSGKLPDYNKFDASFFTVHAQQANVSVSPFLCPEMPV